MSIAQLRQGYERVNVKAISGSSDLNGDGVAGPTKSLKWDRCAVASGISEVVQAEWIGIRDGLIASVLVEPTQLIKPAPTISAPRLKDHLAITTRDEQILKAIADNQFVESLLEPEIEGER